MTCGEGKPGPPAIPRGLRTHLEQRDARLRSEGNIGVTQEDLEALFRALDAYQFMRRVLAEVLLFPHRKEGWFARRRLKKALTGNPNTPAEHLAHCPLCADWTVDILVQLAVLIGKPPPG